MRTDSEDKHRAAAEAAVTTPVSCHVQTARREDNLCETVLGCYSNTRQYTPEKKNFKLISTSSGTYLAKFIHVCWNNDENAERKSDHHVIVSVPAASSQCVTSTDRTTQARLAHYDTMFPVVILQWLTTKGQCMTKYNHSNKCHKNISPLAV